MTALLVGADLWWDMFLAYKVCWLMGRYGGGKTLLGTVMAARLLLEKRVDDVVSNIPLSFDNTKIIIHQIPIKRCAILLDEAWMYLEDRKSVMDYAGFVRKFDHYLILPSVFPINPRLSFFYTQRVFNAYIFGLPAWVYRWDINYRAIREHGYFALWRPHKVFDAYPSLFVPGDDGGIADAIYKTAKHYGFIGTRKEQLAAKRHVKSDVADASDALEALDDTVYTLEEKTDIIRQAVKRIRR